MNTARFFLYRIRVRLWRALDFLGCLLRLSAEDTQSLRLKRALRRLAHAPSSPERKS